MQTLNIAGYKFITLTALPLLKERLFAHCDSLSLKGTILLSEEGINVFLAGLTSNVRSFISLIQQDKELSGIRFRETYSDTVPFKRLKIKIKKEIITLRQPDIRPDREAAPAILPLELKQWLDEKRDFTLLDTRNEYEIAHGTFAGAVNLHIDDFCEFPEASLQIDKNKPVVMFCTGGIRCEKAALFMLKTGHEKVYQLQGGILNYFAEANGAHFKGDCFVFDERVALNTNGIKIQS